MEKYEKLLIEKRFWNFDREIFENFENRKFSLAFQWKIENFENFRKSKIRKFLKFWVFHWKYNGIFRFSKISENVRSKFRNRFSIKSVWSFLMIFFLKCFKNSWRFQKWRLEVLRTQCGRISERNVRRRLCTKKVQVDSF